MWSNSEVLLQLEVRKSGQDSNFAGFAKLKSIEAHRLQVRNWTASLTFDE